MSLGLTDQNEQFIKVMFDPNDLDVLYKFLDIPGRKHVPAKDYWIIPICAENFRQLQVLGFIGDQQLNDALEHIQGRIDTNVKHAITGLNGTLFPFQKTGVEFIERSNGRALVADEMGLGKTIQSIAYLHAHPELRPAIIVVPATLKLDWKQKLEQWMTDPKIEILKGTTPRETTGDIIIINYDILPKWVTELRNRGPKILIMDEIHYIKASSARRTKACKKLAKDIPYVIGLSGTPILNRPSEIYNAVRIINPEIFPVFDDFARRYCNRHYNGFGWDNSGSSNIRELHEILTHTIMIRRLKKDVLNDLPDKLYNFVPIELSNIEEYRSAENDLISFIRAEKGALAAIKAKSAEALVKIEVMKQLAAKGKLQQAIEWIRDFLESDGKLVLFATHKTIIQNLVDEFGALAVRFDGSMTDTQKQKAKEEFQTNPEIKLFIGNIKAASEGITLTAASTVAFLEYPWSPGLLVQCADRCHRIGQKDNVTIHYLLAEGTIDEKIARLLDSKKIVLSQMIDGVEVEQETLLTEIMKMYE